MTRDHIHFNPAHRLALGLAGALVAIAGLLAAPGASAAPPPSGCTAQLACKSGTPTKLWYRVTLFFVGTDTRASEGGSPSFESHASWRLDSQNAVLLKRVCFHPKTRRRPARTTAGPCPTGPGTKRLIDDVSFAAGSEGFMYRNDSTETYDYPDFATNHNGKDGRVTCGEATNTVKLNGEPEITGSISTAAGSQGLGYAIQMPQGPDDAYERDPAHAVHCTFEEYDPLTGTYKNPQPYTIRAGMRVPSYLTDLARGGDAAYQRGMEWSGLVDFDFPVNRFGGSYLKSWNIESEENDRPGIPPLEFDDSLKLLLDPCPKGGRDVDHC